MPDPVPKRTFLDLPRELRDVIYDHLLTHDSPIHLFPTTYIGPTSVAGRRTTASRALERCAATAHFAALRATCRQLDAEAQHAFFHANAFHLAAHQSRYTVAAADDDGDEGRGHLESVAGRFVLARVRGLVVEYTAAVSGDLSGFFCVRMMVLLSLMSSRQGSAGWRVQRGAMSDHLRPPLQVYECVVAAVQGYLGAKGEGELLGAEGVKGVVDLMEKELLRVI